MLWLGYRVELIGCSVEGVEFRVAGVGMKIEL